MRNRYFLVSSFPGQRRDWRRVGVSEAVCRFSFGATGIFRRFFGSFRGASSRLSRESLRGLSAVFSQASPQPPRCCSRPFRVFSRPPGPSFMSRPPDRFSTAFPGLFTASGAILHVTASGLFLHGLSGPSLPVSAAFLHVMASGAFLHGLQGLFSATFPRISSRPLGSAPGGDYFFSAFLSAA